MNKGSAQNSEYKARQGEQNIVTGCPYKVKHPTNRDHRFSGGPIISDRTMAH